MPKFIPLNKEFFKKWSPEMSYVLGYIVADGCVLINKRGAHYLDFHSTDKELLLKIKFLLSSKHKIGSKRDGNSKEKRKFHLQIGSKEIFQDLLKRGVKPRKSKIISLPQIPKKYFHHFVRGYFDGDGHVNFGLHFRKTRNKFTKYLISGFTSGSKVFLQELASRLNKMAHLKGSLYYYSRAYRLSYASQDTYKLYHLIYDNLFTKYYLKRKYKKFQKAIKYFFGGRGSTWLEQWPVTP